VERAWHPDLRGGASLSWPTGQGTVF